MSAAEAVAWVVPVGAGAAVLGGTSGLGALMRTLQGGLRGATVESQADKMRKVMEREVEVGKKAFDAAVEKMSIAIHPALYRLYEDYCEVEGLPPHLVDSVGSGPDLTAFLQDDSYRLAVPPYYRPLLEIDTSRTRT